MDHQIMHDAPPADVHDVNASKEQEVCMALSSAPPCSIPPHQGATGGRVPAAVSFLSRLLVLAHLALRTSLYNSYTFASVRAQPYCAPYTLNRDNATSMVSAVGVVGKVVV